MYTLREVVLKNGPHERKSRVINFTNPKMDIVGEFLMADASLLNFEVLNLIEHVLLGKKPVKNTRGNRCALTITPKKTLIEDLFVGLFDDSTTHPAYEIETKLLKDLIIMWQKEVQDRQ